MRFIKVMMGQIAIVKTGKMEKRPLLGGHNFARLKLALNCRRKKMKLTLILLLLGGFACSLSAQQLPDAPPPSASTGFHLGTAEQPRAADSKFWAATGLMFASTVADTELVTRCMQTGFCTDVPDPLRSRAALYAVSIPANIGVSYLSYRLKRHGFRWWFLPEAVVTAGNIVYGVHASQHMP